MRSKTRERVDVVKKLSSEGMTMEEIFRKVGKNWGISLKTIHRLHSLASREIMEEHDRVTRIAEEAIQERGEELADRILTSAQRMQILSDIARGEELTYEHRLIDGALRKYPVPPDYSTRIKAIGELNRMTGVYKDEEEKEGGNGATFEINIFGQPVTTDEEEDGGK